MAALRMRANMSAIGSVIMMSPTRLRDAGELAFERHGPHANAAEFEVAIDGLGTTAHVTPPYLTGGELRGAIHLRPLTCSCHKSRFPSFSRVSSGTACRALREAPWPLR